MSRCWVTICTKMAADWQWMFMWYVIICDMAMSDSPINVGSCNIVPVVTFYSVVMVWVTHHSEGRCGQ